LDAKPWVWAVAYGVTLIIYGFGYLLLSNLEPHSFYQQAAALEPRYQSEQEVARLQMRDELRDMFRTGAARSKEIGGYIVQPDSLELHNFRINPDGSVRFEAGMQVCDLSMGCGSSMFPAWSYWIDFRATGTATRARKVAFEINDVRARNDRVWFHYPAARPAMSDGAINARIGNVLEDRNLLFAGSADSLEFRNPALSQELVDLIDEARGWPSPNTAEFAIRMFHLSVTTITTTGYGDIVPLTSTARILTGSESLVGTVLLGLFLYSLPYHR